MRVGWFGLLLALAACEASRPDFMVRLQEDCQAGDQGACDLLGGPDLTPGPPRPAPPARRARTLVQSDVEAILQGMERTRAAGRSTIP